MDPTTPQDRESMATILAHLGDQPDENEAEPASNLTPDVERKAAEAFARHHATPEYRERSHRR